MRRLWARAEELLTPPLAAENPAEARTARLLARLIVVGVAFLLAFTPVSVLLVPAPARLVWMHLGLLLVTAGIAVLLRRGHVGLASVLAVAVLWAHVTVSLWTFGGIRAPVLSTFFVVVLMAAMLLGFRAAMATVALCLMSSVVVLVAGEAGLIPAGPEPSTLRLWVVFASNLGLLVVLSHLALSEQREAHRTLQAQVEERQRAEAQLRASEARARSLVDSSPMGIYLYRLEPDGRLVLTEANPAADRILGIDHGPLVGLEIEKAFPPLAATEVPEQYRRVCRDGTPWSREEFAYEGGDVRGVYEVHAFQTGPGRMATLFLDVTQKRRQEEARRQLEEQLRQSQKLEAVGRLAGGVSHDFNNLLMVITGHGELLRRGLEPDDPRLRKVHHIMSAADRASRLVRRLLAFSRAQVLEPRVVDLNRLVLEAVRMLRPVMGSDVALDTDLAPDLGHIRVDRAQIEQVLMNMAVNARDAMPFGGRLELHTANCEVTDGASVPPGRYVVLSVRDTGVGMDARTCSRVFEPFFTTKASGEGTGLGLAMAYGIVQQSGGHLTVDSQPGRGTAFHVHLPLVEDAPEPEAGPDPREAASGSETILVAEDEASIRDLTRELLEGLGYEILCAENGEEALTVAEDHAGPIHLVLADVVMPGLGGRALVDRIQARRPDTRALFMSGHGEDELVRQGVVQSQVDFLPKPFGRSLLARRVRQILDRPPVPA